MSRRRRGTRGSGVNVTNFSRVEPNKFACQACAGRKSLEQAFRLKATEAGQDYLAFEGNVVFAAPGAVIAASFSGGHQTGMIVINATEAATFAEKITEFGNLVIAVESAGPPEPTDDVPEEAPLEVE